MPVEEYVFLSGKGGSGKTSVCAAWAQLSHEKDPTSPPLVVDADVEAANLELLGGSVRAEEHPFIGSGLPVMSEERCNGCGICMEVCRFDALTLPAAGPAGISRPVIDPILCEGCGACVDACALDALRLEPQRAGSWFRSASRFGPLFHAELLPGGENSGKLVARVRQQARRWAEERGHELMLTDGPPGIGCPVISALTGATGVIAVAEAGEAGRSDLERLLELARRFELTIQLLINKADLHPEAALALEALAQRNGVELLGRIPYDTRVVKCMIEGKAVTVDAASPAAAAIREAHARWLRGRRIG
jgi:MinD superfamily P-loop ATPase